MSYDELMKIVRSGYSSDWRYNDQSDDFWTNRGVYLYCPDINVRIERRGADNDGVIQFREKWANCYPDPYAFSVYFDIYYGSSLVESFMLVSVDGGQALLPVPDGIKKISLKDYQIASTVDILGTLDKYIKLSGLTVEDAKVMQY